MHVKHPHHPQTLFRLLSCTGDSPKFHACMQETTFQETWRHGKGVASVSASRLQEARAVSKRTASACAFVGTVRFRAEDTGCFRIISHRIVSIQQQVSQARQTDIRNVTCLIRPMLLVATAAAAKEEGLLFALVRAI